MPPSAMVSQRHEHVGLTVVLVELPVLPLTFFVAVARFSALRAHLQAQISPESMTTWHVEVDHVQIPFTV